MKSRSRLFAICLAAACLGAVLTTSAAQAAAPAWAPIAASGPTNLPPVQSEIQRVAVDAEAGTYTLSATTASGSGTLSGAAVSGKLVAGSNTVNPAGGGFLVSVSGGTLAIGQEIAGPGIPSGTTITGLSEFIGFVFSLTLSANATASIDPASLSAGSKTVTGVTTASGAFAAGQSLSGAGIAAGTTITAVGAGTLTLSALPTQSGAQALTAGETTAPIDFDAEGSEVEAALDALSALEVTVKGGPGDKGATRPYFVTFGGSDADVDVAQMSADSSALSGGNNHTATVTTALVPGPPSSAVVTVAV